MAGETPRVMQSPRIEMTGLGGDELVDVEVVNLEPASDQEELERYPHGNSTAAGAVSNFVNTIVGAGIIGLPFAVSQSGLWAGLLMIGLAAFLNNRSTTMLIAVGEKANRLNYEELMALMFGNAGLHTFSFFAFVMAFGAMAAYLIIIGDTIPAIVHAAGHESGFFADRETVILFFAILIILPVSSLKDLSKLSYTSLMSVMADVLLIIIVIVAGPAESTGDSRIDRSEIKTFIRPTIFAGFGAISFAFVCQSSSFLVYRSMAKGGLARWKCVTYWSVSIAWFMGTSLALAGYLSFVNITEGNILNNFSEDHESASVARGFLAVTMVFTYPMEMYVARHVADASIFQTVLGMGPLTSFRHYGITIVVWGFTVILALATDDLGPLLEIFGACSANAIGFIMPPMLYIQSHRAELRRAKAAWKRSTGEYVPSLEGRLAAMRKFYLPFFMIFFGTLAMITGVTTAVVAELSPIK